MTVISFFGGYFFDTAWTKHLSISTDSEQTSSSGFCRWKSWNYGIAVNSIVETSTVPPWHFTSAVLKLSRLCRELKCLCRELAWLCRELARLCRELARFCRELAWLCRELAWLCREWCGCAVTWCMCRDTCGPPYNYVGILQYSRMQGCLHTRAGINPFKPEISVYSVYILHTVLHAFSVILVRRICWAIKISLTRWLFPIFL